MEDNIILVINKSNELLRIEYGKTEIEKQILIIAMSKIEKSKVEGGRLKLEGKLNNFELSLLLNDEVGDDLYLTMKDIVKRMYKYPFVVADEKGNFRLSAMITEVNYVKGELTVVFNNKLEPYVSALKKMIAESLEGDD